MRVPDIAALTSCPTAVIRAQLLSARGRASDEAPGSASASGGIQCPSSPWKYFFQLMSSCSQLHWRAAPEFLWVASLCFWDISAYCLLPGLPDPPYLLRVPNFLSHPWVSVSPQAPATPALQHPTADQAQQKQRAAGEEEEKECSSKGEKCSCRSRMSGKWLTCFLGRMWGNHPDCNREGSIYFH